MGNCPNQVFREDIVMKENKSTSALKVVFIIIGALVSIAALALVIYTVFKKYFQVTLDCDNCDCDCGDCEECCLFDGCCDCDDCDCDVTPEVEVVE